MLQKSKKGETVENKRIVACGWLQLSKEERAYMEDELHRLIDAAERKAFLAKLHAAKILYLQQNPDIPMWYRGNAMSN